MHMHMTLLYSRARYRRYHRGRIDSAPVFRPEPGAPFHTAGIIFSILGAILVLYLSDNYKLDIPAG